MGSISQMLALMNSPVLEEAISTERSTGWSKLLEEIDFLSSSMYFASSSLLISSSSLRISSSFSPISCDVI